MRESPEGFGNQVNMATGEPSPIIPTDGNVDIDLLQRRVPRIFHLCWKFGYADPMMEKDKSRT